MAFLHLIVVDQPHFLTVVSSGGYLVDTVLVRLKNRLGLRLPLAGDGLCPTVTPEGSVDYAKPLQLLAKTLEFVDPVSGVARRFVSQRALHFS